MSTAPFTLGLLQMRMSASGTENLARALAMLEEAAKKGIQVALLPELFRTPYFCQTQDPAVFDFAEPIPGPTSEALAQAAKRLKITVVSSIFERRAAGVYHNTAAVFDADGSLKGIYRKMHIPDDPLYYEKYYFTPGDLGFKSFKTSHGNLGTLVCWDQWYPEAARLTAMQGADVLLYPTAIGWHPAEKAEIGEAQVSAWQTVQRAHAIANGVYVAACNRVGHEATPGDKGDGIEFFGHSFIADPFGRILAEASSDKEEVITAVCDPKITETTRRHWPFLRDRRIDAYGGLTERFGK